MLSTQPALHDSSVAATRAVAGLNTPRTADLWKSCTRSVRLLTSYTGKAQRGTSLEIS